MSAPPRQPELSIVLPTLNEAENLKELLPELGAILQAMGIGGEVLVVDGGSQDGTQAVADALGARVLPTEPGYGRALRLGFHEARGKFILTMDADFSHAPSVLPALWAARHADRIAIASRYIAGGSGEMSLPRRLLSRALNRVFARGLSLPVADLSSGFRIYPAGAVQALQCESEHYDILPEILIRAHALGWQILETPFHYAPRRSGTSKARVIRLLAAYIRTFAKLWRLRNSIEAADYDERAFDSVIPLQRAWQRRRHEIVTNRAAGAGLVLDIGCGSSRILRDLNSPVGLDVKFSKLRYMKRYDLPLVNGSLFALPFASASFDAVVCSEVIEHVASGRVPFQEMDRVLKPAGTLVVGTPDYDTLSWRLFEAAYARLAPGGYADEHITHYTRDSLTGLVAGLGYEPIATEYVFGSEVIITFRKPAA